MAAAGQKTLSEKIVEEVEGGREDEQSLEYDGNKRTNERGGLKSVVNMR